MADSFTLAEPSAPPGVVPRPALAQWLFDRDLSYRDFAVDLGVTKETVRLLCLPFANRGRLRPSARLSAKIEVATSGEITPGSFHVPNPAGPTS